MSTEEAAIKHRLSSLSPAQRAQLADRFRATNGAQTPNPKANAIPKATPLRVEMDAGGRAVSIHTASNGQERMWFLHHYAPESALYSTPAAFHLHGSLQIAFLEEAFRRVIDRHESLRATFAMEENSPVPGLVQRIAQSNSFRLEQFSAESASQQDRRAFAHRCVEEAARRPFDLTAAPPFRVVLVAIDSDEHLLVIVMHHILSDGWSLSNFCRELSAIYAELATGTIAALPHLPVQYTDFSAWYSDQLKSQSFERHTSYWKSKLAGEQEALFLSTDRPRLALETFEGTECSLSLEPELASALKAIARQQNATFFMILLAAFQVLLYRYTGRSDLFIGVPVAGRPRPEFEALIGLFTNTLVMRTEVDGNATFADLIARVRETSLEAYEHREMPFDLLVRALNSKRDANKTPLFQTAFALRDFPEVDLRLTAVEVTSFYMKTHTSKFDLSLEVRPSDNGYSAVLEFSLGLFSETRGLQMLTHWHSILRSVVAAPALRIDEISIFAPGEREQILSAWNNTEQNYPRNQCIHHLFEEQVIHIPDAIAARYENEALTYRDLNERANQLAEHLRTLGVAPETLVALCLERSLEMLVVLLGILKAGGAYVALDPHLPPARIAVILDDAGSAILLTQRTLQSRFADFAGRCIAYEDVPRLSQEEISRRNNQAPALELSENSAAYVIYTSGSTGRPKGVVVEHRSVVNLFHSMRFEPGVKVSDVLLAIASISFDVSVQELFLPLSVGACVVIAPDRVRADGASLAQLIEHSGITILDATPTTWQMLLSAGWKGNARLRAFTGGEAITPELANRILEQTAELWNFYGPTETTISSHGTRIHPGEPIAIGVPLGNVVGYIVDSRGKPVPVGVPGELWIGGAGVARGYLHRPELTHERFAPDPFSSDPHARIYKSGDRVRWMADGKVEYLSRLDGQVKLRGFRIELAEIESALLAQPEIREAVAVVQSAAAETQVLTACLVANANDKVEASILRSRIAQQLPDYMLPASFVWLDRMPMTPNGKVDRKALAMQAADHDPFLPDGDPPTSTLELALMSIWKRFLKKVKMGRHDNFFALGGNSILATQLIVEIDKQLGCKLPIAALFQSPTIESFARRLGSEDWVPPWSSIVPLQPDGSRPPIFFVHGAGGDIYTFLSLARALGPDQPSYGIQALGLDGKAARHSSVEEMAAHYAAELVSFQTQGPFYLAGYSMGGMLAFELAQQLHKLGRQVEMLALLDAWPMRATPRFLYPLAMANYLRRRCIVNSRRLRKLPLGLWLKFFQARCVGFRNLVLKRRLPAPVLTAVPTVQKSTRLPLPPDYFLEVGREYRFRPYSGSVDLFASEEQVFGWRWYWRHLVRGSLSYHQIPGRHSEILSSQNAPVLASIISSVLAKIPL